MDDIDTWIPLNTRAKVSTLLKPSSSTTNVDDVGTCTYTYTDTDNTAEKCSDVYEATASHFKKYANIDPYDTCKLPENEVKSAIAKYMQCLSTYGNSDSSLSSPQLSYVEFLSAIAMHLTNKHPLNQTIEDLKMAETSYMSSVGRAFKTSAAAPISVSSDKKEIDVEMKKQPKWTASLAFRLTAVETKLAELLHIE